MIKGNEKLIIICGMAHSGTTIVAHVIRQHPDFVLFNNGSMAFILENDFLLNANAQKIESLTQKENRVILKRPWIENNHTDWLIENMPNSYYGLSRQTPGRLWKQPFLSRQPTWRVSKPAVPTISRHADRTEFECHQVS